MDLGTFREHADIVAVLGVCYFAWSAKRILNKLESSVESLTKAVSECDKTCEKRTSDVYDHINTVRAQRDTQMSAMNQRMESAKSLRDRQHSSLSERLARIETAHIINHGGEQV